MDGGDGGGEAGLRATAVRECAEEAGVVLPDPGALVSYSRWITPAQVSIRFDTWFFRAAAPLGVAPRVDGAECVDWRWSTPAAALEASRSGELLMVFPTLERLGQLAPFPSADAVIAHAARHEVRPIEPRVVMDGETTRILLPGEPGYDAPE